MCVLQLMYKKTQVPCPLPILDHHSSNHSLNGSLMLPHLLPNASGEVGFARADMPMPQAPPSLPSDHVSEVHYEEYGSNDMCTPKYFVFNSQVRGGQCSEYGSNYMCTHSLGHCTRIPTAPVMDRPCPFADCVHGAHPDFRLRMPPGGAANLQRAKGVRASVGLVAGAVGLTMIGLFVLTCPPAPTGAPGGRCSVCPTCPF